MTPTDILVFICILFIVLFVGAIIVTGAIKAERKRARGGEPVYAPMGRGHAIVINNPVPRRVKWNRGGFHENGTVYRNGGKDRDPHRRNNHSEDFHPDLEWIGSKWIPWVDDAVRLSVYEKFLAGKDID